MQNDTYGISSGFSRLSHSAYGQDAEFAELARPSYDRGPIIRPNQLCVPPLQLLLLRMQQLVDARPELQEWIEAAEQLQCLLQMFHVSAECRNVLCVTFN